MRGVPLRLEIGPKDLEKSTVVLVRRDTREKSQAPMDGLAASVVELLTLIQDDLKARALKFQIDHTVQTNSREEFHKLFQGRPGFVMAPWCGRSECEDSIKTATQATIRNIALQSPPASGNCIECDRTGKTDVYFAKAY